MADEVFRYKDGDRDELVVLFYPGDETIVVNSSSYGEPSRVPLPREEGLKMAHALLAALDAEPEQGLTVIALGALLPGTVVIDRHGDEWVKQSDGVWRFYSMKRGPGLLVDTYGPITAKDGVGSSRHADKTETGDTP